MEALTYRFSWSYLEKERIQSQRSMGIRLKKAGFDTMPGFVIPFRKLDMVEFFILVRWRVT